MEKLGRILLVRSDALSGEAARLFDERTASGFWERFVRPGRVIDVGYRGAFESSPVFVEAEGLDVDTPGYNGRDLPYETGTVGTLHASHVLEHIADYGHFLRECLRALSVNGTLIIFVPMRDCYERRTVPPSAWNGDHKRFYTAMRLLYEVETSVDRRIYRVLHLHERFRVSDFDLPIESHAAGPYEIECVIQKIDGSSY